MLAVSDAFIAAAVAAQRKAKTRVTCTLLGNAMLPAFVEATAGQSETIFADDHLVNGRTRVVKRWALARDDCLPADDLYPPDDDWETGWMGDELSDASGNMSPAEEILIEYTTAQRVSAVQWWADAWLGYPVDFVLYYWDTEALCWVEIETVTGNAATSYTATLASIVETTKLKMTISKISRANDHPALVELQGGLTEDITQYVTRWDSTKERFFEQQGSLPLGNYGAGELNLELANTDDRFAPANADGPYYGYLRPNRILKVEVGFDIGAGVYEYCDVGTYYVTKWACSSGDPTAKVTARDHTKLLQSKYFEGPVRENALASDLIADLAAAGGLDQSMRSVDATEYVIPYAVFERDTIWEHMKRLAIGEGGCLYFAEDGTLVFENRDHLAAQTTVQATLDDDDNIIKLDHDVDEARIRNSIRVTSKRLKEAAESVIWELQEPLLIPGQGIWWDADWLRRVQLTITAAAGNTVTSGLCLKLEITGDDAAAIHGVCQSDGGDLRVLYTLGGYFELDRRVDVWRSDLIRIYFRAQAAIAAGDSDTDYYLYYYNPHAGDPPADGTVIFDVYDSFDRAAIGADWIEVWPDGGLHGQWDINTGHLRHYGPAWATNQLWHDALTLTYIEMQVRTRVHTQYFGHTHGFILNPDNSTYNLYGGYAFDEEGPSSGVVSTYITTPNGYSKGPKRALLEHGWYTFRLRKEGTTWLFYIDNVLELRRENDDYEPAYVGLNEETPDELRYDEFWMRQILAVEPTIAVGELDIRPAIAVGVNTATIQVQFQGPAVHIQEPYLTAGGPDLLVYDWEYNSVGGWVTISNTGPDEWLTGLQIEGKLLEADGELVATAEDAALIAEFGELGYELENDYIQDLDQAQTMADALLASYADPARQITIGMEARGMPHLQMADRVHVENEQTGVDADYHIVRSKLEFDGALSGELTCIQAAGEGEPLVPEETDPLLLPLELIPGLRGLWLPQNYVDGVLPDSSGQARHLTAEGAPVLGTADGVTYLDFDGIAAALLREDESGLAITGALTIDAWVQALDHLTEGVTWPLAGMVDPFPCQNYLLVLDHAVAEEPNFKAYVWDAVGDRTEANAIWSIETGKWYHVIMRFAPGGPLDILVQEAVIGAPTKWTTGVAPAALHVGPANFRVAYDSSTYSNIRLGSLWEAAEAVDDDTTLTIHNAQAVLFAAGGA